MRVREGAMVASVIAFWLGMWPPEDYWLIALGLAGFVGAWFIPKDW